MELKLHNAESLVKTLVTLHSDALCWDSEGTALYTSNFTRRDRYANCALIIHTHLEYHLTLWPCTFKFRVKKVEITIENNYHLVLLS